MPLKVKTSESSIQSIAISKIRMDGGTQPRAQLFSEVVDEYYENMQQGATFPPVIIYFDGEEYWLADGFHRVRAKEATGAKEITAEVFLGTQRDAVLYAVGANAAHGLRRTNADKRRAVERLLRDHEWKRWSDNEIARQAFVSQPFVSKLRAEIYSNSSDSDFAIRTVNRSGKTFPVNTTNIGQSSTSNEPPSKVPKRQRTRKQVNAHTKEPRITESKKVVTGDIWKLGKFHYLFCGDPESSEFQKLLPSEIALLLFFPRKTKPWLQEKPENVLNTLSFYTSYGEDIDLRNLRLIIENCLSTTTEANDSVIVFNLPDPSLFILMESLYCLCYCAEPDPQRCTDALTAWAAINQTVKRLSN
ncbi:ParB N-terminal domain-containing protein (plasmid) [Acaryochloris sp. 'Moss Beach']|uniref:streptomycin biosynthesis regulator n=1 Tax=Acaryochloris sp. 'Moss Beach' TaxID=2740837 RepID=UPI001F4922F5|nr:streptomycin biosynthesis regulator [Acaryochloris sp. 'Moss Beach']UJB72794.1 ParB N-terminal domain-containing protein [Acaryochloris sp. 'Moss Beach']